MGKRSRAAQASMVVVIVALVIGLIVGGAVGWFTKPKEIVEVLGPTETTTVTTTVTTIPTSTPKPTPTPGPAPPPEFNIEVHYSEVTGFNRTTSEFQGDTSSVLVLPPGGVGTIPVKLISTGKEDYTISLSMGLAGERGVRFEGVECAFNPSTLSLEAGGEAESVLTIEVDGDAPTAYYEPSIGAYVEEEEKGIGRGLSDILVSPYTPKYIYRVHIPTPGMPGPIPTPGPTPAPTETPSTSFELATGGKISIILFILNVLEPLSLKVTSPKEVDFDLLPDPLEVVPRPEEDRVYLLNITANPDAFEGTYEMAVTGNTESYTFEWVFNLVVQSP